MRRVTTVARLGYRYGRVYSGNPSGADARVRAAVATATRHRRRHAASVRLWRSAPFIAAVLVAFAILSRWLRWPDAVPLTVVGAACVACLAYLFLGRRDRDVSDAMAAAIDADAGLGGELRSANWFAQRTVHDPWVELHLDRAARRLHDVDWAQLYPRVRAHRSRLATAVLVVLALAVTVVLPERAGVGSQTSAHASSDTVSSAAKEPAAEVLPPDLQKLLEELLVAAERGTASTGTSQKTTSADMRALLERLQNLRDREELKDLARSLDRNGIEDDVRELLDLAERVRHAAEKNPPKNEVRNALEDLARKLSQAAEAERTEKEFTRATSEGREPGGEADTGEGAIDAAAIQSVKEAQGATGAAGVMMMSDQNSAAGAPSPGFGLGGSSDTSAASQNAAIDSALRQEVVEADTDSGGANVESAIRRQTEQGQASTTFTRSAATKSDASRAAAPPIVPEARRPDLQRYFHRKQ